MDKSGRQKVFRGLNERFLEEARQDPENLNEKGKLTKEAKNTALALAKEERDHLSIFDLVEFGVKKGGFRTSVAKSFESAGLFVSGGKNLKPAATIGDMFNLNPETGAPVTPGGGPEPGTVGAGLSQLETDVLSAIAQGGALLAGDFSSPLASDLLQTFNERVVGGTRGTAGEGAFRGGRAREQRSVFGRMAAQQHGAQLVSQGLSTLGVTSPLDLPPNQLGVLNQEFNQQLFQDLLNLQLGINKDALDRATDFGGQFTQNFSAGLGASLGQLPSIITAGAFNVGTAKAGGG
ncbi:MAG: hypothetical protein ACXAEN_14850 [Candidatus Thorarchaeota archaeon]